MAEPASAGRSEARRLSATCSGRLPPRNGAGHGVEHEDPAQSALTHLNRRGYERPDFFDCFEANFVVHAGKGFARIDGFAVAMEITVVVWSDGGISTKLSRPQPAGERHSGANTDLLLFSVLEELVGGTLAEAVEDNLHGLHIWELDCPESVRRSFDADSVIANLADMHPVIDISSLVFPHVIYLSGQRKRIFSIRRT